MRKEWYLCKYKNGVMLDKSPYAMSRSKADNLKNLAQNMNKGFTWQVKHRKDLK